MTRVCGKYAVAMNLGHVLAIHIHDEGRIGNAGDAGAALIANTVVTGVVLRADGGLTLAAP